MDRSRSWDLQRKGETRAGHVLNTWLQALADVESTTV